MAGHLRVLAVRSGRKGRVGGATSVYPGCMTRTNIDLDDELVTVVMQRFNLRTKKDAVDFALRRLAGPPLPMELLAGAPNGSALLALETLTNGLPWLDIDVRLDFHAAAAVYRTGRARGYTVRSLVDCLIAVVAARHGVTLLHRDADFDTLDACLPELGTISLT